MITGLFCPVCHIVYVESDSYRFLFFLEKKSKPLIWSFFIGKNVKSAGPFQLTVELTENLFRLE